MVPRASAESLGIRVKIGPDALASELRRLIVQQSSPKPPPTAATTAAALPSAVAPNLASLSRPPPGQSAALAGLVANATDVQVLLDAVVALDLRASPEGGPVQSANNAAPAAPDAVRAHAELEPAERATSTLADASTRGEPAPSPTHAAPQALLPNLVPYFSAAISPGAALSVDAPSKRSAKTGTPPATANAELALRASRLRARTYIVAATLFAITAALLLARLT